jgi:hypothetical protein
MTMESILKYSNGRHSTKVNLPKWFIAKIVFNIVTGSNRTKSQFEEQLRLVEAESIEEALLKARAIGIGEEEDFVNDDGRLTKWEFVDVAELLPIASLNSGVEIYSQIHETEESRQYIHSIHQRGIDLRNNVDQSVF